MAGRRIVITGGSDPRSPVAHPGRPGLIGYRVRAWLAVALVAAVVVLVPVVSDAAAGPRSGVSQRPVATTVVTVSAPADPRATEGPALQDRHRVLSW